MLYTISMRTIFALSGFLGLPKDWNSFPQFTPITELNTPLTPQSILLGYSMGGRRVLQHLIQYPNHYHSAIIISAHPGLQTEKERELRAEQNQKWAAKFLSDPWENLMHEWNTQAIFTDVPDRQEHHYSRKCLSDHLLKYSLAKQPNLRLQIADLSIPILWITGERDEKFTQLAESVHLQNPRSKKIIAPEAGHRVPWENMKFFTTSLEHFIGETYDNNTRTSDNMDNDQILSRY